MKKFLCDRCKEHEVKVTSFGDAEFMIVLENNIKTETKYNYCLCAACYASIKKILTEKKV